MRNMIRLSGAARAVKSLNNKRGMEMVQVAILVAIAVAIGIIFKTEITDFVNETFKNLDASKF
ncbi:Flp1 family type IVb pilin [Mobilibacterium timonense]|uniref:Flp1 family type IVb pilin n=1 Tax=Mobilibacterium timonense TaxID=1871012 RepID=UPI000985A3CC|nr:Flp1 family type IVb pilin [Mobilibacterium timonense]